MMTKSKRLLCTCCATFYQRKGAKRPWSTFMQSKHFIYLYCTFLLEKMLYCMCLYLHLSVRKLGFNTEWFILFRWQMTPWKLPKVTPKGQRHALPALKEKIIPNSLSLLTSLYWPSPFVLLKLWCCFFSHYVLNLEYAKQIKEVAIFFQEFVCKLPATAMDNRQKNATYLSVTTNIQKYAMSL